MRGRGALRPHFLGSAPNHVPHLFFTWQTINRFNMLTHLQQVWRINRERAIDYLNTRNRIYVVDGFAGWDEKYRIRVRVVCARAYHALFMRNMLIRPDRKDLEHFHPDYTIYNAGSFPANRYTEGMTSGTSVAINFAEKEMVILGTEYAGEMKKGKYLLFSLYSRLLDAWTPGLTSFFPYWSLPMMDRGRRQNVRCCSISASASASLHLCSHQRLHRHLHPSPRSTPSWLCHLKHPRYLPS